MKPIDYLHLQMELEGIQVRKGNLITRTHPDVEDFPLVLYAHTNRGEKIVYFDDTIPIDLYNKLTTGDLQSFEIASAVEDFRFHGISSKVESFKTYTFPKNFVDAEAGNAKCFRQDDPKVIAFGFDGLGEGVYAVESDGKIISACVSSRENTKSAESWVFTDPGHRRKGLAQQVVTAWARNVLRESKIPFYSHAVENVSSYKVAIKLKLVHLYDETVIT